MTSPELLALTVVLTARFIEKYGVRPNCVLVRPDVSYSSTLYRVIITDSIADEIQMALL